MRMAGIEVVWGKDIVGVEGDVGDGSGIVGESGLQGSLVSQGKFS